MHNLIIINNNISEAMCWVQPLVSGTMPPPRLAHSAEVYANRMVIFGGYDGKIRMNDVFVLDFGMTPSPRSSNLAIFFHEFLFFIHFLYFILSFSFLSLLACLLLN